MFEVLSHQTHMHQHKLGEGNFLNSFFLCLFRLSIHTGLPTLAETHSHTQTKTQDAPTSVLGRVRRIRPTNGAALFTRGALWWP